ncbi:MAG: hypothetical protein LBI39_02175 [Puniceicoccales bacterium]|nr:hypothetical protein [Puniceicoccales bacterium]
MNAVEHQSNRQNHTSRNGAITESPSSVSGARVFAGRTVTVVYVIASPAVLPCAFVCFLFCFFIADNFWKSFFASYVFFWNGFRSTGGAAEESCHRLTDVGTDGTLVTIGAADAVSPPVDSPCDGASGSGGTAMDEEADSSCESCDKGDGAPAPQALTVGQKVANFFGFGVQGSLRPGAGQPQAAHASPPAVAQVVQTSTPPNAQGAVPAPLAITAAAGGGGAPDPTSSSAEVQPSGLVGGAAAAIVGALDRVAQFFKPPQEQESQEQKPAPQKSVDPCGADCTSGAIANASKGEGAHFHRSVGGVDMNCLFTGSLFPADRAIFSVDENGKPHASDLFVEVASLNVSEKDPSFAEKAQIRLSGMRKSVVLPESSPFSRVGSQCCAIRFTGDRFTIDGNSEERKHNRIAASALDGAKGEVVICAVAGGPLMQSAENIAGFLAAVENSIRTLCKKDPGRLSAVTIAFLSGFIMGENDGAESGLRLAIKSGLRMWGEAATVSTAAVGH